MNTIWLVFFGALLFSSGMCAMASVMDAVFRITDWRVNAVIAVLAFAQSVAIAVFVLGPLL
jgi:hypothetical protein